MQAFPTGYAPQSGYPTQGPYSPGAEGQQLDQQPTEVRPALNSPDMQPLPPPQPQTSAMPPPIAHSPMYSYYPFQQQQGYNMTPGNDPRMYPPPPPQPRMDDYDPALYMEEDCDNGSESYDMDECHEVIGITLGGKPCPPPQDPVVCCDCKVHRKPKKALKKCKRTKPKEKSKDGESPCAHTFCIIERAKVKPVGMPWASGLYKYQPPPEEPPKIKVIRRKCQCGSHRPAVEEEYCDDADSYSSRSTSSSRSSKLSTTNTSNQMLAFMEVFCSLLGMVKKNKKKEKSQRQRRSTKSRSGTSTLSFCCDD